MKTLTKKTLLICITAILACFMIFCACGCDAFNLVTNKEVKAELNTKVSESSLLTKGTLTIGVDTSQLPYAGKNQEKEIVGLDVDLASQIALEMGLKAKFVDISSKGITALTNKEVDVCFNMTANPTDPNYSFTNQYVFDGISLFSLKDNKPQNLSAINFETDTFTVVTSSTAAVSALNSTIPQNNVIAAGSIEDCIQNLKENKAKFMLCDSAAGNYFTKSASEITCSGFIAANTLVPKSCAVLKTNAALLTALNDAIKLVSDGGQLKVIVQKWEGSNGEITLPKNVDASKLLPSFFPAPPAQEDKPA
ncbi:MAG: transporter substrate-binding domain-containing protein [Coriobacteriales bacterium]|nr:transporter substrate-binding domain-containing protein [Coriobacteriales bacterium]